MGVHVAALWKIWQIATEHNECMKEVSDNECKRSKTTVQIRNKLQSLENLRKKSSAKMSTRANLTNGEIERVIV